MRRLLIVFCLCFAAAALHAESYDGIFVWVDGGSTCYKLEQTPTVTYADGCAVLTVGGKQALKVALADARNLVVTYGTYKATDGIADAATESVVRKNGKFIRGGRLVIVKDGKQYDANGILIKTEK